MIVFFGSLTFMLILSVIAVIGIIIALENEREGTATFMVSVALGIAIWLHGSEIMNFIQYKWLESILFSVGYIVVGIIWSFIKWNEKVKAVFRKFSQLKAKFIKEEGELSEDNQKYFISGLSYKFKKANGNQISLDRNDSIEKVASKITPVGLENKSLIVSWIGYWPLSLIGTLLNNPFRRLFEWIYESLSGFYDSITNKHKNEAFKEFK